MLYYQRHLSLPEQRQKNWQLVLFSASVIRSSDVAPGTHIQNIGALSPVLKHIGSYFWHENLLVITRPFSRHMQEYSVLDKQVSWYLTYLNLQLNGLYLKLISKLLRRLRYKLGISTVILHLRLSLFGRIMKEYDSLSFSFQMSAISSNSGHFIRWQLPTTHIT